MLTFITRVSIGVRLWLIAGLALLGALVTVTDLFNELTSTMWEAREAKVLTVVESAYSIIEGYDAQVKSGELDLDSAKAAAITAIKKIRYGDGDYVWINGLDLKMVMHPIKPALDGKELGQLKDPSGKLFFAEMVNVVKKDGAGYVDYLWPKPGKDQPVPKRSFVKGYAPWGWVVGSGIYVDDVEEHINSQFTEHSVTMFVVLVVVSLLCWGVARSVSVPIKNLTLSMAKLSDGDLSVEVDGADRRDEIGLMARAVAVFKDNALAVKRLEEEQQNAEAEAIEEKKRMMSKMAMDFETSVGRVVDAVNAASGQMLSSADEVVNGVNVTRGEAQQANVAADEASGNVETVAAAAEELSASITEIGRQVEHSTRIVSGAVEEARQTQQMVSGLVGSAAQIGQVVELITAIAEQTNLLALNATIEAARAGDAGKGFAVVASEVKNLANQTARATDQIKTQIDEIQGSTQNAAGAIERIGLTIGEIQEVASAIAAAVEEQGAATAEIAGNVEGASKSTGRVSSSMEGVLSAADRTGSTADQMMTAANHLQTQSSHLSAEVEKFLAQVRSA